MTIFIRWMKKSIYPINIVISHSPSKRPEARPIEFTNGRGHFYGKKKVDMVSLDTNTILQVLTHLSHSEIFLSFFCVT